MKKEIFELNINGELLQRGSSGFIFVKFKRQSRRIYTMLDAQEIARQEMLNPGSTAWDNISVTIRIAMCFVATWKAKTLIQKPTRFG